MDRILKWVPFPLPGDLPNARIEPRSAALPADALWLSHWGSPLGTIRTLTLIFSFLQKTLVEFC